MVGPRRKLHHSANCVTEKRKACDDLDPTVHETRHNADMAGVTASNPIRDSKLDTHAASSTDNCTHNEPETEPQIENVSTSNLALQEIEMLVEKTAFDVSCRIAGLRQVLAPQCAHLPILESSNFVLRHGTRRLQMKQFALLDSCMVAYWVKVERCLRRTLCSRVPWRLSIP